MSKGKSCTRTLTFTFSFVTLNDVIELVFLEAQFFCDHLNQLKFSRSEFAVDHSNLDHFCELLFGMSYGDAEVRPLLDLEGLKAWVPGRVSGYAQLAVAVDRFGTIDGFVNDLEPQCR